MARTDVEHNDVVVNYPTNTGAHTTSLLNKYTSTNPFTPFNLPFNLPLNVQLPTPSTL
jgi:hypothetical protein